MSNQFVDVRCPLPRSDNAEKQCNRLCVKVAPGSSGQAYCPRHDETFEFEILDNSRVFSDMISAEKPPQEQSNQIATPVEHP